MNVKLKVFVENASEEIRLSSGVIDKLLSHAEEIYERTVEGNDHHSLHEKGKSVNYANSIANELLKYISKGSEHYSKS